MYNTKFILSSGIEVYPGYLDKEQREKLKEQHGDQREYMRCGCRPSENLFYRISEDDRIYPEHNNYLHSKSCCRYKDEAGKSKRQTAYIVSEENGVATAFLSFNPKEFTISTDIDLDMDLDNDVPTDDTNVDQEEVTVEGEKQKDAAAEKKEPKMSLPDLIRSINADCYSEKILNNRMINSREAFSKYVYFRMKKVCVHRMKKSLGDLTLENDGVRFLYLPFIEASNSTSNGTSKCYIKTLAPNGKVFSNFTFPKIMEKALKKYRKMYGCDPDQNTMIAGFQYFKRSRRRGGSGYRILGRIHLFQVSNNGIYCRSLIEMNCFNQLEEIISLNSDIRFWIPPEEENIGAIVEVKGFKKKVLLLFRNAKDERIEFDPMEYVPYVVEDGCILSAEKLKDLLSEV